MIGPQDDFVADLMKLFNMPKNITGFTIHVDMESALTVNIEYLAEEVGDLVPMTKKYSVELKEEE